MGMTLKNSRYASEINVTPFVDVMLVLLVIFMITAPMLDQGIEIDLPQTKEVEVLPTDSDHLVLTVRRDGKIYLDSYEVPLEELEERVKLVVKDQSRSLFLQADNQVAYGIVVDIMGRIKSAGIEHLGIVANPVTINSQETVQENNETTQESDAEIESQKQENNSNSEK